MVQAVKIIRLVLVHVILIASARSANAAEAHKAEAPPGHAILKHTRGGAVFVPKGLKEQYDRLVARVEKLRADLAEEKIEAAAAALELREVEPQLDALRKAIEASKVLVSPMKVQQQTEEFTFDLAAERLLVITADRIKLVGWDGPQVKCVLEKTLLAAGDALEEAEFKATRVVHKQGVASDLVGKTEAEWDSEEQGEKSSPARDKLIREIRARLTPFRDFQGKAIDAVSIHGLTHEQGNRHISVEVSSRGGGSMMGGDWRRDARLTVYVPACKGVILRGCLGGVEVKDVKSPMILTSEDSHDRDYEGEFQIAGVQGAVTVLNVPLDRLENVRGDVKIISTLELLNTGTRHDRGLRVSYSPPARECVVNGIEGNFTAWFSRSALSVSGVLGAIDISNEAGETRFASSGPLAKAAHRIVSQSGRIELTMKAEHVGKLPVSALTSHGDVSAYVEKLSADERSFSTSGLDGARRNWRGFVMNQSADAGMDFAAFERPEAAMAGQKRAAGLDVISRSGNVTLKVTE